MNSSPNLWLSILVAAGLLTLSTPVRAQDLSEERTDGGTVLRDSDSGSESGKKSPYRGVLAAADDSGSGITGADGDASSDLSSEKSGSSSTSEDGSPREDVEEKPKKKKKSGSWWPFGRSRDNDSKKKKKKKTDDENAEITPAVDVPKPDPLGADAGADSRPIEKDALAPEKVEPATADAAVTPADPAAVSERTKNLTESLPADVTERAKRGDSRIKDLLDKAQAIKNRQAERVKEADEAKLREDEHAREMERESARLRAAAARGELPDDTGEAADDSKASKADKLKALNARREELIAEGAPQEKLDALDARIAALKKPAKKDKKGKKDADATEPVAKAGKKSKSKAARTGKTAKTADETATAPVTTAKKKKKKKATATTEAKDDLGAPPMPTDAAPEPAPAAPGEDVAAAPAPKKKKKKASTVAPVGAPSLDTPAVPSSGDEFKLDSPAPASSPGL